MHYFHIFELRTEKDCNGKLQNDYNCSGSVWRSVFKIDSDKCNDI